MIKMINIKSSKFKFIFLLIALLILFSIFNSKHTGVFGYNSKLDREFILNIFKNNWYWLVSENSTDFSAQYMLDNKSSSRGKIGDLNIKVYYEKNNPVGFVAYFMRNLYDGHILFVAVAEKYRGHGYSKKLIDYAVHDLKQKHACIVSLTTRTNNKTARALYVSTGFKQIEDDGQFVRYKKIIE